MIPLPRILPCASTLREGVGRLDYPDPRPLLGFASLRASYARMGERHATFIYDQEKKRMPLTPPADQAEDSAALDAST